MSTTTSLRNVCRNANASCITRTHASGSSPFTWKIGACTILATSVAYTAERPISGAVVNPSWLLTTRCRVPPTVWHAEDRLLDAVVGGGRQQRVEHRDRALGALEAVALVAEVLRVQEALERLGGDEPFQDPALFVAARLPTHAFDVFLDPG